MTGTQPKPFVFVLMPFDASFGDIYEFGIKAACIEAGAYCERVDEQIFTGGILERVYNQISKADIIVAEMTGRNPNVFYEVGYAHALNKQVILLTQSSEDIPFDLKHYPHIIYGGRIARLKDTLGTKVNWCLSNSGQLADIDQKFNLYINDKLLTGAPRFLVQSSGDIDFTTFEANLLIENKSLDIIRGDEVGFGFLVPGKTEVRFREGKQP